MGNIDRADWHYGRNYPPGLLPENGGTHIRIYLASIIHRGLGSSTLRKHAFPELLGKEARAFTKAYYETNLGELRSHRSDTG